MSAKATARWWRVVVKDGKITSCREVDGAGNGTETVHYVRAFDIKQAGRLAMNAHSAKLLADRRARYEKQGLCKCGRARDRANSAGGLFKTCSGCFERHAVHDQRKKARGRGETVPPLDRRTVLLERKQKDAATIRLETLVEVQKAWAKSTNNQTFTRWLKDQITAINGKAVA